MLKLLETLLSEKKEFIDFVGYLSTCKSIDIGVPQGSVLGPLLFLVYINNLQNNITIKVLIFSDDTLLYTTLKKHLLKEILYINSQFENV